MIRLSAIRTCLAIVATASLFVRSAFAQGEARQFVDLKYEVDPTLQGCPSLTEFRGLIQQQLGYDPYRTGLPMGVQVRILPIDTGIEGTIRWSFSSSSSVSERRFAARLEDCHKMMATVGFVIAVQIQLMAAEKVDSRQVSSAGGEDPHNRVTREGSEPESRAASSSRGADAKLTLERFVLRRVASPHQRWTAIGLGPSVGFGLGPKPLALGRLFFAVRTGWLGLDASLETSLPVEARESYGGGFRHAAVAGTLGLCGWHRATSVCALTTLGQVQIHGFGVDKPASPKGLIARVGPRLAHSLRLADHLMLLGHVDALFALTPWTVALNRLAVWTMPRFGAAAGIDVAVFF